MWPVSLKATKLDVLTGSVPRALRWGIELADTCYAAQFCGRLSRMLATYARDAFPPAACAPAASPSSRPPASFPCTSVAEGRAGGHQVILHRLPVGRARRHADARSIDALLRHQVVLGVHGALRGDIYPPWRACAWRRTSPAWPSCAFSWRPTRPPLPPWRQPAASDPEPPGPGRPWLRCPRAWAASCRSRS